MWTPKRIVLLVIGFALFFTGYFSYSFVLGGIDGLPPLPQDYLKPRGEGTSPPLERKTTKVEEKLRQAFGLECPESKRPIKLELSRNNMVLAADNFKFDEGRLVLMPFSVALFGKAKNDGRDVEVNTIRSDIAYLTFDRPIATLNPNEINGRKITGAELTGNIAVINNRRSARRDDDLELFIKTGPLYYLEKTRLIWTYDDVHLTDRQSKPKPNEVWGKGLEMELLAEAPPPAPGQKPQAETITGVKRITLQSNVDMHLYIDGRSGFMSQTGDKKTPAKTAADVKVVGESPMNAAKDPAKDAADKSHLHIMTPGRFQYFFFKDHDTAHFEVTPGGQPASTPGRSPRDVTVRRHNEKLGTVDQLICQRLDLKLLRKDGKQAVADKDAKPAEKKPGSDPTEQSIDIESAHATGKEVTLTSDAEKLEAHGNDLLYEAKEKRTILKGEPYMTAVKEDNTIFVRELHIQDMTVAGTEKTYQHVIGYGPGQIDLLDKKTGKKQQHAYWMDKLVSTKDERTLTPKGTMQDMLLLTGKAKFADEEHGQVLEADSLKVWLSQSEKPADKATPASSLGIGDQGGARVEHIEAIGNVKTESSELNVHDTGRLVVWFKDAAPGALPTAKDLDAMRPGGLPPVSRVQPVLPDAPDEGLRPLPPGPAEVARGSAPMPVPETNRPTPLAPGAPRTTVAPQSPAEKKEEPRPIDLSARSVEAWVLRGEVKNTLEKLWCEGTVHVRQAPAKPGEQGVDIKGETLNMVYHPDGNLLVVTGNEDNLAQLQMDKILVIGPEVNIDQAQNKAWVTGAGAMRIDSATTLDNKPLEKSEPLDIHWDKSMFIKGRYAEFNGGIQATQGENKKRMACNILQVNFDQPISLKEGNKSDKPPKVQSLLCDQNARVEERTMEGEKLIKVSRLVTPIVSFEVMEPEDDDLRKPNGEKTENSQARATGPGQLWLLQRGGADPLAPPNPSANPQTVAKPAAPKPGAKPVDPDQLKLTLVNFGGSMYANSKKNFASFRHNVRVLHLPVENPNMDVDIDVVLAKLPEDAMYLSCHHLEVYTRQEKGKNYQEMYASEQAVVQSKNFWGRAATIHFDEAKDQVIFDGGPGGTATLYKSKQRGDEMEQIKGQKIIYNRTTGEFRIIGGKSLQGD